MTLATLISGEGIFSRAEQVAFKTRWAGYKEETELYMAGKMIETLSSDIQRIHAGETLKEIIEITEDEVDITVDDINTDIEDIIKDLNEKDKRYAVVYHGELHYVLDDRNKNGKQEAEWCIQIGIPILELRKPSNSDNKKGDYEYVNGVYLNTPKLDIGFNKNYTRYVNVNENGVMEPGNWISERPEEDWYNYKEGKWANIVTENKGIECYYTWIPRYCFKLNVQTQRADVKLIDINNNYKDPETDEETTWAELEALGYQIPEAFTFDGQELAGYWAMKYNLGESPTPSLLIFTKNVSKGIIRITNIKTNNLTGVTKYKVFLNSHEEYIIDKPSDVANITSKQFDFENMIQGDNIINITAYNNKGEMLASYTDVYAKSVVNPPNLDTIGFNKDTTFYVTYDENGKEHSTVPISDPAPAGWYNYDESEWANVVTRNSDGETYFTWIPRYEFYLDPVNEESTVKFIKGISKETTEGYQIPDAFTFDSKELTGFWSMKYNVGEVSTPAFSTEVVASSSTSIITQGITGTGISESGLTYNYYINKEARTTDSQPYKTTTNASEKVTFEGLSAGKEYTILVEIRKSDGSLRGSVVRQTSITEPNKPNLEGFNPSCTYYVLYDNSGRETIGANIKNDGSNMPNNWYDYAKGKWANIVTTNKNTKTYFTWIPRYQFKLNQQTQRSDVKFIQGTGGATGDYQIPDAFTFDGKPLTGYWAMKYNIGEQ